MSNRVCFVSKENEDISNVSIPHDLILEGGWRYDAERNCLFTMVKTIEVYGDRLHGVSDDVDWLAKATEWADRNNLKITSDYELHKI